MSRMARVLAFGSALLVGIALTADNSAWAFQKEHEKVHKEIVALAKELAAGGDISDKVAAFKKKGVELEAIMHSYKPGNKGGIGFGKDAKGGLEAKVIDMEKRISAGQLKSMKEDLLKLAYINAAIAEIATHYPPDKPKGGKGAKEWKQYSADQKKASMDLAAAIKAGSVEKVKAAAKLINGACSDCHRDFRD